MPVRGAVGSAADAVAARGAAPWVGPERAVARGEEEEGGEEARHDPVCPRTPPDLTRNRARRPRRRARASRGRRRDRRRRSAASRRRASSRRTTGGRRGRTPRCRRSRAGTRPRWRSCRRPGGRARRPGGDRRRAPGVGGLGGQAAAQRALGQAEAPGQLARRRDAGGEVGDQPRAHAGRQRRGVRRRLTREEVLEEPRQRRVAGEGPRGGDRMRQHDALPRRALFHAAEPRGVGAGIGGRGVAEVGKAWARLARAPRRSPPTSSAIAHSLAARCPSVRRPARTQRSSSP